MPLFTACSSKEEEDVDITLPTITVKMTEVDISGGKQLRVDASQLLIGEDIVATWSDDKTEVCKVTVTVAGVEVQSGAMLNNA